MSLEIIILAAGLNKKLRSAGQAALVKLGAETVLSRQVRLLKQAYPRAKLTVVLGYEADQIRKSLPKTIRVVVNNQFEDTNSAESINLALQATKKDSPVLIVYGDLVFNEETIANLPLTHSSIIVDASDNRPNEVGVNVVNGSVMCFSYGLKMKWAHICLLTKQEKVLLMSAAMAPYHRKSLGFELLNDVLERGGSIKAITPTDMKLVEVDRSQDIRRARLLTNCTPVGNCA